jgi:superfamily II RNA helicase
MFLSTYNSGNNKMVKICNDEYPSNSKYESYFELYPYPLSSFQKYAIEAIVEGHHVLVTAHTGSGKTLPAEFAIQNFTKLGKKVIYTSPIKALSNQKFYEFTNKYPEISFGLLTGDIKTNPNADVLIMTTEILMNYLFTTVSKETTTSLQFQMDIQNELACVVFDEIHYINDQHRGQTWEQTILMLPKHIQMVMLSATIDNPEGFARWAERNDDFKEVYLASTNHRVVPLTHYAFLTNTESIFKHEKNKEVQKLIRDTTNRLLTLQTAKGVFNENTINEMNKIQHIFDKNNQFMKRKMVLNKLTEYLKDNEMLPAIAFVFSRKNVENCAKEITTNLLEDDSKVSYNVARECEQIIRKFPNFKEYLELPEYISLVSLLERGIGIHHSGMIPVLREIVELMISKRYIKLLFATESFAIGLDCPIKTAIFTSLTKFDGSSMRYLMSHEYTQMAGRAGRRGIDTVGHVIHCNNLFQCPSINDYKYILSGKPQKLISKFHISYSTVLNLLKNERILLDDFTGFIGKSMLASEIENKKTTCLSIVNKLKDDLNKKEEHIKIARTPIEDIIKVKNFTSVINMMPNKKRKETERMIQQIKENNKWFESDFIRYNEYLELHNEVSKETNLLNYNEGYIKCQAEKICTLLENNGLIQRNETNEYSLLKRGKIASNLAEIHSVIGSIIFEKWNSFNEFTVKQLIGLFSCFTDIKVSDENRQTYPFLKDSFLKTKIKELSSIFSEFEKNENALFVETGIQYDNILCYDLIDEIQEWASYETEHQCKYFIQTQIYDKEISIGEFTKAVLKITTITKEFMTIAENLGEVELLFKLSQIEPMILKYITTAQSLYV